MDRRSLTSARPVGRFWPVEEGPCVTSGSLIASPGPAVLRRHGCVRSSDRLRALSDKRGRKEIPPWVLEPTTPAGGEELLRGEKEYLAIIWAVQILRPYLQMGEFDLFTDNQALRWIFSLADGSNRLARWRDGPPI